MRSFANALCVGGPRDDLGDALSAPLCGPFGIEPCFTVSTKGRCRYRKEARVRKPDHHPPGCVCRTCANLWDEIEAGKYDEPDIDVCTNCGAYFTWYKGLVGERCGRCSKL